MSWQSIVHATSDLPLADREEFTRLDGRGAYSYWGTAGKPRAQVQYMRGRTYPIKRPGETSQMKSGATRASGARERSRVTGSGRPKPGWGTSRTSSWMKGGWEIRYVVVDTRDWLPGKKVLVTPYWISAVSWPQKAVYVDLTQDEVERPRVDSRCIVWSLVRVKEAERRAQHPVAQALYGSRSRFVW